MRFSNPKKGRFDQGVESASEVMATPPGLQCLLGVRTRQGNSGAQRRII